MYCLLMYITAVGKDERTWVLIPTPPPPAGKPPRNSKEAGQHGANRSNCNAPILLRRVQEQETRRVHKLQDIGRPKHTLWDAHTCRIKRDLTKERCRPWFFEEGWECNRHHTIVGARLRAEYLMITKKETNWDAVRACIEEQELRTRNGSR